MENRRNNINYAIQLEADQSAQRLYNGKKREGGKDVACGPRCGVERYEGRWRKIGKERGSYGAGGGRGKAVGGGLYDGLQERSRVNEIQIPLRRKPSRSVAPYGLPTPRHGAGLRAMGHEPRQFG